MNHISIDDFRSMYNFESLIEDEIYPSLTQDDNAEDFLKYLIDNFEAIRKFYNEVCNKIFLSHFTFHNLKQQL